METTLPTVHSHRSHAVPAALKPRKKPLQTRSTVTVDAIVEATIRILRRDGWAACTTTRIAALAGVSVGSLYQYFPNRNAIAVEIVRQRTRTYLTAVIAADLSAAATPEENAARMPPGRRRRLRRGSGRLTRVIDFSPSRRRGHACAL